MLTEKRSFVHLVVAVLVVGFIVGIAVFVLLGATTNKGTTGAISAEYAKIMTAETSNCHEYGTYASLAMLEKHGLLTFVPTYNSVLYLPGKGCGSIVVGSSAYQSPAG